MPMRPSANLPPAVTEGLKRGRLGCLGCLGKAFVSLLGILIFGALAVLAIDALFNPWSFYMGGRFHPIPLWRGWGKMHSASGRDYVLYVWFEPYHYSGRRVAISSAGPGVVGWGTLCTPRGESYNLHVSGGMERHMGSSTDGKHMSIYLNRRPWYFGFVGLWDERPQLEFHGVWHNPDLVLDDRGSLDRAFNADGTLHSGPGPARTPGERGAQLTLHEGSKSEFEAACREVQLR
jgi:hypothetical protein